MRLFPLLLVVIASLFFAGSARAEDPLPDVVETRDGGIFRGLIVERVPGQYVVIRTASNELRRVEEANIRFAGRASAAVPAPDAAQAAPETAPAPAAEAVQGDVPQAPPPPPPAPRAATRPGAVRLQVTSDPPRLTLMLQTGEAFATASGYGRSYGVHAVAYDPVCTAPCETELEQGVHVLAVREPNGRVRAVRNPVDITGDAQLELGIESRRKARLTMWLTGLGLVAVGTGVMLAGIDSSPDPYDPWATNQNNIAMLTAGGVIAYTGLMLPLFTMFMRDRGRVEVRPAAF